MNSKTPIYHEKQVKELCALHALNNLFQVGLFDTLIMILYTLLDSGM